MVFDVVGLDGKVKMHTEHKNCLPSSADIDAMDSAGYRFRVDGEFIPREDVLPAVNTSLGVHEPEKLQIAIKRKVK